VVFNPKTTEWQKSYDGRRRIDVGKTAAYISENQTFCESLDDQYHVCD